MRHVTRYRAYPSHAVEQRLFTGFARCTFVRNWCLENKVYRDSCLPKLKEEFPELKEVHSKVLQNVVQQIAHNLHALKRLKATGRKVGKLRKKWVHSMIYEQTGFKLTGNHLWLSKIGEMRIELSRAVPGTIKQIVVKHTPAHQWFVAIISETSDAPEPTAGTRAVGIDLNLENFSTDTDGAVFEHPHNVRKSAKRLRRAQRKLSRAVNGSRNRRKQRVAVARIHELVENRRDDFLHTWSRYYVDRYDHIALEHLNIRPMVESLDAKLRGRSRSILDAAWYKAREFIRYKAANAGTYVHLVDPAYTTE
ncbi:MAG: transposase, partial [Candidatus Methanomethylophilaceae archaeon]|nr:transposase [Candidatus Methanomethylophilaceae archaeon]